MSFFDSFMLNTIADTVNCGRMVKKPTGRGKMPNVEFPTLGGTVFWKELAEKNGLRLQKNMFTGHCRILDHNDIRKAWGTESSMWTEFFELTEKIRSNQEQ